MSNGLAKTACREYQPALEEASSKLNYTEKILNLPALLPNLLPYADVFKPTHR
jgi:hypothetical protein